MEKYFLVTKFDDGWREEEFVYEESVLEYCTEALEIPIEKIEDVIYTNLGMEISLNNLTNDDIIDDWYINLNRVCNND